jgi:hypothetical protein
MVPKLTKESLMGEWVWRMLRAEKERICAITY